MWFGQASQYINLFVIATCMCFVNLNEHHPPTHIHAHTRMHTHTHTHTQLRKQDDTQEKEEQTSSSRLKSVVMRIGKRVANTRIVRKAVEKVSSYPLVLTVVVNRLDGILAVNIPPPTTDTIWYVWVCERECVCVCVCECVCVCVRESVCGCVWVRVCERERVCVCGCVGESVCALFATSTFSPPLYLSLSSLCVACRFGFTKSPRLELVAKPKLGQREVKLSAVTLWIEKKLREVVDVSFNISRPRISPTHTHTHTHARTHNRKSWCSQKWKILLFLS